ncbi:hypothetical protein WMF39_32910 [Sorangium sp. So ce1504]|uniref:hypothetical protein n=1 Tax=Sorangium sp. So ce1504 TaxID=3133337 RepID=UPI003F607BD3
MDADRSVQSVQYSQLHARIECSSTCWHRLPVQVAVRARWLPRGLGCTTSSAIAARSAAT